jgi:hypothetical protein
MAKHTYLVADNRAIVVKTLLPGKSKPTKIVLKGQPGTKVVIPSDVLGKWGPDEIKRLIKSGFVVRKGADDEAETDDGVMVTHEGKIEEAPPAPPKDKPVGLWNVDPKKIKTKKLDELNVMIAERDPSRVPAKTVAEAIQQLSVDFEG